jgi:ribosomal protein S27AE
MNFAKVFEKQCEHKNISKLSDFCPKCGAIILNNVSKNILLIVI